MVDHSHWIQRFSMRILCTQSVLGCANFLGWRLIRHSPLSHQAKSVSDIAVGRRFSQQSLHKADRTHGTLKFCFSVFTRMFFSRLRDLENVNNARLIRAHNSLKSPLGKQVQPKINNDDANCAKICQQSLSFSLHFCRVGDNSLSFVQLVNNSCILLE